MDAGGQFVGLAVDRALGSLILIWLVGAICSGQVASESKKRRFWVWFTLSLLTGPFAWYLLIARVGVAIPKALAVTCPPCGKKTRSDEKRYRFCKKLQVL